MRIAVLVKQIPAFEEMRLGRDGRLVREGLEPEMNAYCRRAVSQACASTGVTLAVCSRTSFLPGPLNTETMMSLTLVVELSATSASPWPRS